VLCSYTVQGPPRHADAVGQVPMKAKRLEWEIDKLARILFIAREDRDGSENPPVDRWAQWANRLEEKVKKAGRL
jgi:hypothetical protein